MGTSSVDPGSMPSDGHEFMLLGKKKSGESNEEVERLIKDIVRE